MSEKLVRYCLQNPLSAEILQQGLAEKLKLIDCYAFALNDYT